MALRKKERTLINPAIANAEEAVISGTQREYAITSDIEETGSLLTATTNNGSVVVMRSPTIGDLLEIEEGQKKEIGQFEQSLLLLSKIIVKFGDRSSVNVSFLANLSIEDIKLLNDAFAPEDIDLDYDIATTPAGNESIVFNLSDLSEVEMIRPNGLIMLETERELVRRHKNAGDIKRALIMTARLMVRFHDSVGEKSVSYHDLLDLKLSDWGLITAASSIFFRS